MGNWEGKLAENKNNEDMKGTTVECVDKVKGMNIFKEKSKLTQQGKEVVIFGVTGDNKQFCFATKPKKV